MSRIRKVSRLRINAYAAAALTLALLASSVFAVVRAEPPAPGPFENTWARTDRPIAAAQTSRTWMWGPEANTGVLQEFYNQGPNNRRNVQYFDKTRMELNVDATVPDDSEWKVTNGLLVVEMMTGLMQMGHTSFNQHDRAEINVVGDPDYDGITYATLDQIRNEPALPVGNTVLTQLDAAGNITRPAANATYGVTSAHYQDVTRHSVASVFWDFMNSTGVIWNGEAFVQDKLFPNPFYATGFPITEAYWTNAKLAGVETTILLQCFERRCLSYTPTNPDGWKVEAGNVGQHYFHWRYELVPNESEPTPIPSPTATATTVPTATPTPEPTATLPNATHTGDIQFEAFTYQGIILRNMQVAGNINMTGWEIRDDRGNVFVFPNLTVREGFYVTVSNCTGENQIHDKWAWLYWGECVDPFGLPFYLYDSSGNWIDTLRVPVPRQQ